MTCWLGPYFVKRGGNKIGHHGLTWQIVTANGFVQHSQIPYKVDAEAQCAALNLAGGVIRPPPLVSTRQERRRAWRAALKAARGLL